MNTSDTITACATGAGRSARAIVRLSGQGIAEILATTLRCTPPPGASSARFWLSDHLALPVLVLRSRGPKSYTGEETAELLIPGNPSLVDRVLARLTAMDGVRLAEPGEFTARAYLHGKLDLDRAEGVAATIAARTEEELSAARDLLDGRVGRSYRAWADETATLLALVESEVDFSDQESVVAIAPQALRSRLASLVAALGSFLGVASGNEPVSHAPLVVMVGAPNAGKSTLFNALLGRPRAVVSDEAGTTRDALREPLDLSRDLPGASAVELADVAGLDRFPPDAIGVEAQRAARETLLRADAAIYCDPSGEFVPRDELREVRSILRVRTKADLPASTGAQTENAGPGGETSGTIEDAIPVCALDGWNLGRVRRWLADISGSARSSGLAALLPRHRRALGAALDSLRKASDLATASDRDRAVLADTLRAALDALGELVGRISPDDVLGRIFSTFCVGK